MPAPPAHVRAREAVDDTCSGARAMPQAQLSSSLASTTSAAEVQGTDLLSRRMLRDGAASVRGVLPADVVAAAAAEVDQVWHRNDTSVSSPWASRVCFAG
jgi:hypothetical protein